MPVEAYNPLFTPMGIASQVSGVAFKRAVSKIRKDTLRKSATELEYYFEPTATDFNLKANLWNEVFKRYNNPAPIDPRSIYEGTCSYTHWYNNILGNPTRLAWLVSPANCLQELIEHHCVLALSELREILDLDIKKDGKYQYKIMDAKIRIFELLDSYKQSLEL